MMAIGLVFGKNTKNQEPQGKHTKYALKIYFGQYRQALEYSNLDYRVNFRSSAVLKIFKNGVQQDFSLSRLKNKPQFPIFEKNIKI
ncbi:MAG: hypothetical protein ACQEWD_04205 [Bacteroidota bacterium]|uniref:hypothetical protein n=1 Tax=Salegentibacter flavus TaxID=287099 RepID=UPI00111442B4|nr:hypothetical protein [Salegentibacter flavus]